MADEPNQNGNDEGAPEGAPDKPNADAPAEPAADAPKESAPEPKAAAEPAAEKPAAEKPAATAPQKPEVLTQETRDNVIAFLQGATILGEIQKPDDKNDQVTASSGTTAKTANGIDIDKACIACQQKEAAVILEPCHHRVLCQDCATKWCPVSCPTCSCRITRRVLADKCLVIRPHIHSPYSFLA